MLIIEGSDCLGKTTLCKALCLKLRATYGHMSRPGPGFNFGTDYLPNIKMCKVQDRFHLGALVWHDNVMTEAVMDVLDGVIQRQGGLVVVLVSNDEDWYVERLRADPRKQMFSLDQLLSANRRFEEIALRRGSTRILCNREKQFATDAEIQTIADQHLERVAFAMKVGVP